LKYPSSYFLVTHGSRDPRPQRAVKKLAALVLECLAKKYNQTTLPLVDIGSLEFGPASLAEQLQDFAKITSANNLSTIKVIPLFLLEGVHVTEDIPAEVEVAQKVLENKVKIEILPYLGGEPEVCKLLENQQGYKRADSWILLSHGSRRSSANETVEKLAKNLGAFSAYWSVEPSLEKRVKELVESGYKNIAILPYFLFSGGITDAIAQRVEQLALQIFPVNLVLLETLEANQQMAKIIVNLIWKHQ